jgi:hypothetical protein
MTSAVSTLNSRTAWLVYILTALIVALLLYLITTLPAPKDRAASGDDKAISHCMDAYGTTPNGRTTDVEALGKLNGFCFTAARSQLLVDEENIREDNFVFQRYENIILLFIVVTLTLSGVVLAGLQLLASYKLAVIGRGELSGGAEVSYSQDAVSFKSSVVGLAILFISFAFFMVFVLEVYTLKEGASLAPSAPGIAEPFRLRSVPGQPPPPSGPLQTERTPTGNMPPPTTARPTPNSQP